MMLMLVALILGAGGGSVADGLRRGRDPRSNAVIAAGIVGGLAGLLVHRSTGTDAGVLLDVLWAFGAAATVACAARARISSAMVHAF